MVLISVLAMNVDCGVELSRQICQNPFQPVAKFKIVKEMEK